MAKHPPPPLGALTVRGIDPVLKLKLKRRAADHDRSMEDEMRALIAAAVASVPAGSSKMPAVDSASADAAAGSPSGLRGATVLLVIGGGIAAYKALDLIRRLREAGATVRPVMTKAAQEFVTPLSVGALAGGQVFTDLFAREDEFDVGHIRLAREASAVVVAPATADLMARMATGRADDLATAILLATDAPVLLAPAMNPKMWAHVATQRNVATLVADGVHFVGPDAGEMAETNEAGIGRMAEPLAIRAALAGILGEMVPADLPLAGRHVVVTSGPTHEPIDPVRYLANRSSGRQGHAIAAAAAAAGARVTLVSGPVALADPPGVTVVHVETAREMRDAVLTALPADVAVFAAAVADWRAATETGHKIKKGAAGPPQLALTENPDILATVGRHATLRPRLVVGFAAETDNLLDNAGAKLKKKGADWIVANDVSPEAGVMGGGENTVHILRSGDGGVAVEDWPRMRKEAVATRLVAAIADAVGLAR